MKYFCHSDKERYSTGKKNTYSLLHALIWFGLLKIVSQLVHYNIALVWLEGRRVKLISLDKILNLPLP